MRSYRPTFRVMKFGGTSVAGAARMRGVADLVAGAAAAERVGVVASAVSGVTDLLIQGLAHAAAGRREEAEAAATRFRDVHAGIAEELAGELGAESSARLARRLGHRLHDLTQLVHGIALFEDKAAR